MPISLTCTCGARLEIDDKFPAGQSIPCPDCHKPIRAEPPLPEATRTSGLAVLSLILALVGAFTIVGTLAAIACGAVAYRQLTRRRDTVGGVRIAQAGMILGAVFTVLAVAAYSTRFQFGLDGLYRQYRWAGKLKFDLPLTVSGTIPRNESTWSLERPSAAWGMLDKQLIRRESDILMLVNLRDDAHILWLYDAITEKEPAIYRSQALSCFQNSDLVKMIGPLPANVSEALKERGLDDGQRVQEFFIDVSLGGIPRTFLVRVIPEGDRYINVLVCGARASRFEALKAVFRQVADTFKQEIK